jgi:hypothetical protein
MIRINSRQLAALLLVPLCQDQALASPVTPYALYEFNVLSCVYETGFNCGTGIRSTVALTQQAVLEGLAYYKFSVCVEGFPCFEPPAFINRGFAAGRSFRGLDLSEPDCFRYCYTVIDLEIDNSSNQIIGGISRELDIDGPISFAAGPDGLWYGSGARGGAPAFTFSGQWSLVQTIPESSSISLVCLALMTAGGIFQRRQRVPP